MCIRINPKKKTKESESEGTMQQNPFGTEQIGIQALEKSLIRTKSKRQLQIGVPKETAADEHRIALTPSGVASLTANGHTVTVERDAGGRAQFSDDLYLGAGAAIADSPGGVFGVEGRSPGTGGVGVDGTGSDAFIGASSGKCRAGFDCRADGERGGCNWV